MLRGFWAVVDMAFRLFFRDKHGLFWGIAFPLMLMGLIGTVFGGGTNIVLTTSVVVDENDPLTRGIAAALHEVPALRIVEEDEETALAALRRGDRSLVVVLPTVSTETMSQWMAASGAPNRPGAAAWPTQTSDIVPGFSAVAGIDDEGTASPDSALSVRVYYDEMSYDVAQAGIAIINAIVDETNRRITGRPDVLTVETSGISAHNLTMFDFLLPGILAMVLMQSGLMGVTAVLTSYRERLLLKRVLATPFSPGVFLAGLVARFTITNLIQGAVIVLVGVLLFRAQVVGSYLNLFVLSVIGSVTFLAIGFAISTVSDTPDGANTLGSAVSFPMMFLSGTFWPRELIPDALQPLIGALPLTPLVEALRGVATQADSLAMHAPGLLYMGIWGVAALVIAIRRFRWE